MNMISLENHAQTRTRKSEIRGMTLEKTIRNAIPQASAAIVNSSN